MGPKRANTKVGGEQKVFQTAVRALQTCNQVKSSAAEPIKSQKGKVSAVPQKKAAVTKVVVGSNYQTKQSPQKPGAGAKANQMQKRGFMSEAEISDIIGGLQIDRNNNVRASQESLNMAGPAVLVNIVKVYSLQQQAFDKLDGSRLVEDVLLRGKYWRDTLNHAEEKNDQIIVHGLKIVFHNPSMNEMSKKRFFACIHLHNTLKNFGIRSALAFHIDISRIKHRKVAEISNRIIQLVGDGYNLFAYQFKILHSDDRMKKLFLEPGAYGIYIGFAFILDYLAYRNAFKKCKASPNSLYTLKKYVEVMGPEGYVIKGIEKSAGQTPFDFEVSEAMEDLNLDYVEHLFNNVRLT